MNTYTVGKFITFDGCEAAGKTTQIELLHRALLKEGILNIVTREPGGTPFGEKIRSLFLEDPDSVTTLAQIYLMFSTRAQHVETVILPALQRGEWVICDRFIDATRVYQCDMPVWHRDTGQTHSAEDMQPFAIHHTINHIDQLYSQIEQLYYDHPVLAASGIIFPAHNFILDLSVETIVERLAFRTLDNQVGYDKKPAAFHAYVRKCYRDHICQYYPNRTLIDATQPIPTIHEQILSQVLSDK